MGAEWNIGTCPPVLVDPFPIPLDQWIPGGESGTDFLLAPYSFFDIIHNA